MLSRMNQSRSAAFLIGIVLLPIIISFGTWVSIKLSERGRKPPEPAKTQINATIKQSTPVVDGTRIGFTQRYGATWLKTPIFDRRLAIDRMTNFSRGDRIAMDLWDYDVIPSENGLLLVGEPSIGGSIQIEATCNADWFEWLRRAKKTLIHIRVAMDVTTPAVERQIKINSNEGMRSESVLIVRGNLVGAGVAR
jgi:hypothetical protein